MKFKFNLKLTAFLVSLFISLLLVILGSNNKYCLSFGFILMGVSLAMFIWYNNEKVSKELTKVNAEIDELEIDEELNDEERVYILQQLYIRQKKLSKKKKSTLILFSICGCAIVVLGVIGLF